MPTTKAWLTAFRLRTLPHSLKHTMKRRRGAMGEISEVSVIAGNALLLQKLHKIGRLIVVKPGYQIPTTMQVERTNDELIIRVSASTDLVGLQRLIDYIRFREIASKSKATQKQVDELARESKDSWWRANKKRFVK